jgi:iron complex outermembrane receptor protein
MPFQRKKVASALALLIGAGGTAGVVAPASAQDIRVEVTGTNIRRVEGETALPVTIIRSEDLARQGITTAEQVLSVIPSSQALFGISQGVGLTTGNSSQANLRGLGENKTLVLVNGRRLANFAYSGTEGAVDLNAIPMAAVDRIEVLRDGASAIYGTDAIGGVINFILRKDYQGADVSAEYYYPEESGGKSWRATAVAGWGDLEKNGFNVFASIDYRKQDVLRAADRDFANTGIRPDKDFFQFSGTGFPANVSQVFPDGSSVSGNPYYPGCRPSIGSVNLEAYGDTPGICRFDFARYIDIIPENEQLTFLGKATFKLGKDHQASIEYLRAETNAVNRVAPTPVTGLSLPANSPYFPGKGSTPGVAGLDPTQPIGVNWRTLQAGPRTNEPESTQERAIGLVEGTIMGGWDYQVAGTWNRVKTQEDFTNGYVRGPEIRAGVLGQVPGQPGLFLNPFNDPTQAEDAYLQSTRVLGRVIDAKGEVKGIDGRITGDVWKLPAGPLAVALGAEYREEEFSFDLIEENVRAALSSGLELATDVAGKRDVTAFFGEASIPIVKGLEATLALRYDDYSDVGSTTNPKVSLRWQPVQQFLLRGSYNTGFRAPTLYELLQPEQITFTSDSYDDPLLCPGGNPVSGSNPARDCGQQFRARLAGNGELQPEKSKTYTIGFVWEPTPIFSVGIDYWHIKLRNQINVLGEQTIFADPVKYADRFFRCGDIPASVAAGIPDCFTGSGALDARALAYINQPNSNLGDVKTAGYDISLAFRPPATEIGRFAFTLDGTYVDYYDYQREPGGEFVHNVGSYQDSSPVFRWQHVAQVNWTRGPWGVLLVNRHKNGYTDQDPIRRVGTYSVYDLSATYTGFKNVTLTAGIRNLFDRDPPFSNQITTFQVGYDPRFSDPLGRTYWVRAAYSFK